MNNAVAAMAIRCGEMEQEIASLKKHLASSIGQIPDEKDWPKWAGDGQRWRRILLREKANKGAFFLSNKRR